MSRAFAAAGMKKGDRVIVCLPNIPQAVIAFYALSRLGAIPAPIHPLSTPSEILRFAELVSASWAITLDGFFPRFAEVLGSAGNARLRDTTIVCSIGGEAGFPTSLGYALGPGRKIARSPPYGETGPLLERARGRRRAGAPELAEPDPLSADEPALILFSGGSTGESKAILLSNRNCNALAIQTNAAGGPILPGDAILSILPMFHGFGLAVGIHAILVHGGTCVLVPRFKARAASPPSCAATSPPSWRASPTLYDALAADPAFRKTPLGSFKGIFCGGDSLSPETKYRFEAVLRRKGCGAAAPRGLRHDRVRDREHPHAPRTSTASAPSACPIPTCSPRSSVPARPTSARRWRRARSACPGPRSCSATWTIRRRPPRSLKVHPDGRTWLHSGDIGCMDADGFFYFRQRAKRIIKTSGIAVYPSQVEDVLNKHPAVRLSCVIGVPHPDPGRGPEGLRHAERGLRRDDELEKELIEHCRKQLIPHSCPRRIEFLSELPMTRVGKVAFKILFRIGNRRTEEKRETDMKNNGSLSERGIVLYRKPNIPICV